MQTLRNARTDKTDMLVSEFMHQLSIDLLPLEPGKAVNSADPIRLSRDESASHDKHIGFARRGLLE